MKSLASVLFSVENWVVKGEFGLNAPYSNLSECNKYSESPDKVMDEVYCHALSSTAYTLFFSQII